MAMNGYLHASTTLSLVKGACSWVILGAVKDRKCLPLSGFELRSQRLVITLSYHSSATECKILKSNVIIEALER